LQLAAARRTNTCVIAQTIIVDRLARSGANAAKRSTFNRSKIEWWLPRNGDVQ
jgi:hypothetical protein